MMEERRWQLLLPLLLLLGLLLLLQSATAFRAPVLARSSRKSVAAPRASWQAGRGRWRGVAVALFSGIVEQMGRVAKVQQDKEMLLWNGEKGQGMELTITDAQTVLADAYEGCSIAVNGVCLTVVTYDDKTFTVGCAPETIRRTNLGALQEGALVNLERSLPADGRNSGHMVQGHVDECGQILDRWQEGDSLWVKVKVSKDVLPYIVTKGYIAVDGTSLTVCEVNREEGWFTLMLIAYTQKHVILPQKQIGDTVNLEVDVLAKYVERSVGPIIDQLRDEIVALQTRLATLEKGG